MLRGRFGEWTMRCHCLCAGAGKVSRHSTAPGWGHQACLQNCTHKSTRDLCNVCLSKATDQTWALHSAIQMLRWNFWWCLLYTGQSLGLNLQVALSNTSVGDWEVYIWLQDGQLCCKNVEFTVAFFKKMLKNQKIHVLAAWYVKSQKDWLCLR